MSERCPGESLSQFRRLFSSEDPERYKEFVATHGVKLSALLITSFRSRPYYSNELGEYLSLPMALIVFGVARPVPEGICFEIAPGTLGYEKSLNSDHRPRGGISYYPKGAHTFFSWKRLDASVESEKPRFRLDLLQPTN